MNLFFKIEDSVGKISDDPLRIILHYSPAVFGYTLFSAQDKRILQSEIWEKNTVDADPLFFIQKVKDKFPTDHHSVKIFIINYHLRYTTIPASVYTENNITQWWYLLEGFDPDEKININTSINKDIVHIQAVEAKWFQSLSQSFSQIEWIPFQAIAFDNNEEYSGDYNLILSFIKNNIFITLRNNEQVLFNQGCQYKEPEDILYSLLNILHRFAINPESVRLLPDGFIDPDSSVFRLLEQYFKNIYWSKPTLLNNAEEVDFYSKYGRYHIDKILSCVS